MSTTSFVMPNDLSDLCRVCLQLPEESQYLDLTTIYDEEDNLTYGECFTICTQIDLSAGDGVPHHLCKTCGLELQMSYDFHKKIEESKRVIEQCQKQIQEQKENIAELLASNEDLNKQNSQLERENSIVQFINNKYVISENEMELAGTSQELEEDDESVMQHVNEEKFEPAAEADEETDEIDILSKMCQNDITTNKDNSSLEIVNVNDVAVVAEEHLEVEDYQNLEALEEEAKGVRIPPPVTTTVDNTELQNFIYINRPEFCANVQKYEPILTEETVIEEEISQDATDKWLDTLNDIDTQSTPNSDDLNVEINEIPQDNRKSQTTNTNQEINNTLDDKLQYKEQELKVTETYNQSTINGEIIHQQKANSNSLSKNVKSTLCLICNKSFITHNKLNWHMRMHDKNRKRFVCPIESCGRIYASKQACDLHYRQTHLDEGIICPVCHKIFSAKQTLEVHMRYHTREFPYKCNLCERKFAQKGHLTQHIEVKHQNLRYICTEPGCGKIFQNSVSLRNHRYTHSSMPFKCNRCDKEYPQKNKLRAHLLHKHDLDVSLDDLESMRQFNIIRSRHAYVKIQTDTVKKYMNTTYSVPVSSEDLEVEVLSN